MSSSQKNRKLNSISIASNTAGFTGAASMALSYSGLLANYFNSPVGTALTGIGSYVLYPIVAVSSSVESAFSWATTHIDRRQKDNKVKNRHVANSVVSTMASVGFTVAIIGSLVGATVFSIAAPVMFMSVIGSRAAYNLGAAIYWKRKAATIENNPKYKDDANLRIKAVEKYSARANDHAKSAALGTLSLIATTTVFLLGYLVFAPIGIAVNMIFMAMSIVGIVFGIKSALNKRRNASKDSDKDSNNESNPEEKESLLIPENNNTARLESNLRPVIKNNIESAKVIDVTHDGLLSKFSLHAKSRSPIEIVPEQNQQKILFAAK